MRCHGQAWCPYDSIETALMAKGCFEDIGVGASDEGKLKAVSMIVLAMLLPLV